MLLCPFLSIPPRPAAWLYDIDWAMVVGKLTSWCGMVYWWMCMGSNDNKQEKQATKNEKMEGGEVLREKGEEG